METSRDLRDTAETVKSREITRKYTDSSVVWYVYVDVEGVWTLAAGFNDRGLVRRFRDAHEAHGRRVQIYGCNVKKRSSKLVYETPTEDTVQL